MSKERDAAKRSIAKRIYGELDDDDLAETIAKLKDTVRRLDAGEGPHLSLQQRADYRLCLRIAEEEQQRRRT